MSFQSGKNKALRRAVFQPLALLCLITVANACEKIGFFDDLKGAGETVTEIRAIETVIDAIMLNDDVNLVITRGDTIQVKIEGGKNLLAGIETKMDSNKLVISNKNKLNWLRSYDNKITAYVTLPDFTELEYNSTGRVSCTNMLTARDSLTVRAIGGSGYISLLIGVPKAKLSIFRGCSADMTVSGNSGITFIYAGGYGPFYCENLHSKFVYMRSVSTNICKVYASELLEYDIQNIGDIIYYGSPTALYGTVTGKGKLIKGD